MVESDVQAGSDVTVAGDRDDGRPSPGPQARESRKSRRIQGVAIFGLLKRLWIPLVILVVVVAGGFTVSRLHGIFGSEKRESYADTRTKEVNPVNTKHLRYEVFGPPGTVADISYFDVKGVPQHINAVHLPWSFDITTDQPSMMANVVAQGDTGSLGCRILVDDKVQTERVTQGVNAFTFCVLTAT